MIKEQQKETSRPRTLEEFKNWEFKDGFKYEWNDGELIKFEGMNKHQLYILRNLNKLFNSLGLWKVGALVSEQDLDFSPMQMRRPDTAYFTDEQIDNTKLGIDETPEFTIKVISKNDNFNHVEAKLEEYFKYGVKAAWVIIPDLKKVKVYTSIKENKNCFD